MTEKELETLEKVYTLASKPGTKKEGAAALKKLELLCKKHRIRLSDHIKDAVFDMCFVPGEDVKDVEPLRKWRSRRAAMKSLMPENIWDFNTLAEYLSDVLGFGTLARCKHACSGMSSDMKVREGWVERVTDDGRRCYTLP